MSAYGTRREEPTQWRIRDGWWEKSHGVRKLKSPEGRGTDGEFGGLAYPTSDDDQ